MDRFSLAPFFDPGKGVWRGPGWLDDFFDRRPKNAFVPFPLSPQCGVFVRMMAMPYPRSLGCPFWVALIFLFSFSARLADAESRYEIIATFDQMSHRLS